MLAALAMIRRYAVKSRLRPTGLDVEMAPEKALCEELGMCCGFLRLNAAVLKGGTEKPKSVWPLFNLNHRTCKKARLRVVGGRNKSVAMLIRRRLYGALQSHLAKKEITLLVGARQVGKTTLMKALRDELHGQGVPVLFLNLDIHSDRVHFLSQEALIQKIRLEFGVRRGVVFIDEIQRLTNAGLFLKGLYDMDLPVKFVVSGSGSLELKEKIRESLVGRKRLFELYPVSLAEFLDFRTGYRYSDRLPAWAELDAGAAHSFLLEYLNFGGYPRVVVEGEAREKKLLLQEIFQSYLEKDISDLLNLARPDAFILLIRLLADRI